jgi:hypothetical protein
MQLYSIEKYFIYSHYIAVILFHFLQLITWVHILHTSEIINAIMPRRNRSVTIFGLRLIQDV